EIDGAVQAQRVEATLVDENGGDMQSPIVFDATRSVAEEVAYDPADCGNLAAAKDVQAAVDTLARRAWIDFAEGADQEVLTQGEVVPLTVRVVNACGTVQGATVSFQVTSGTGSLSAATASTDANGIATTQWTLGPGTGVMQTVDATLTAGGGVAAQPAPKVRFSANLSRADHVSYEAPAACPPMAGADTVQEAIDHLVRAPRLFAVAGDGVEAGQGEPVELSVRLWNLCAPVDGQIRFRVDAGDGTVVGANPAFAGPPDGIAAIGFTVGSDARNVIVASVVDPQDASSDMAVPPVTFTVSRAQGEGTCTVSVRPGGDISAAAEALPSEGGELCLAAGIYDLADPATIDERRNVVVSGRGSATILRAVEGDTALLFRGCDGVTVRDLRIEAGQPGTEGRHRFGGITCIGSTRVKIVDCELSCADGPERSRTCLTIRRRIDAEGEPWDAGPIRADVERNRFEVGAWQVGALLLDVERATVARNELRLGARPSDERILSYGGFLAPELRRTMTAATVKLGTPGSVEIDFPGREAPFAVPSNSPLRPLWQEVAARTSPRGNQTLTQAIDASIRSMKEARFSNEASKALLTMLASLEAVGQGIVVGGTRAETVQVLDNVVDNATESIHIGLSDPDQARESAGEVVVDRNVIHARVPATWTRQRHGVLVSNARSAAITDTKATLERPGQPEEPGEVEGVRVQGVLGRYMKVRQTSLQGFPIGVRVRPSREIPDAVHLWFVAETMAAGGRIALDAPEIVLRDRNFT
ncbi:MAG: Ig-like domain-containing protein, partial [Actinomycetota bacterium]|nr:Ig-like domain-containing protein [Actinomycetota bacterium]